MTPECTKIAHRRSLAIFTADEGIAGNSAVRIIFARHHRRKNRGSLAIFFAEEIAHLGASKSRGDFSGSGKNRRRNRRESRDFGALSLTLQAATMSELTCLFVVTSNVDMQQVHPIGVTPQSMRTRKRFTEILQG